MSTEEPLYKTILTYSAPAFFTVKRSFGISFIKGEEEE